MQPTDATSPMDARSHRRDGHLAGGGGTERLPLLGYLAGNCFYAAEGLRPAAWVDEASGVAEMAVAADPAPGASPVLGYVTADADLEVLQGRLSGRFSLQAADASSLALSSVTNS